mgnify:CR=1 FL=1
MNTDGWLMHKATTSTKHFHRDHKSWAKDKDPYVFVDTGKLIPNQPALLQRREYLHFKAAFAEWERLRFSGWIIVKPQWKKAIEI